MHYTKRLRLISFLLAFTFFILLYGQTKASALEIVKTKYIYADTNGLLQCKPDGEKYFGEFNDIKAAVESRENLFVIRSDNSLWTVLQDNKAVKVMDNVKSISDGYLELFIITNDNKLYYLYTNLRFNVPEDIKVEFVENNVSAVSANSHRTYIVKNGFLYCIGFTEDYKGYYGQTRASGSKGYKGYDFGAVYTTLDRIKDIVSVYNTTLFINTKGELWGFGRNDNSLLSANNTEFFSKPVKITDNVKQVSISESYTKAGHALAVKNDGTLWAWGANYNGELGTSDSKNRNQPVKVMDNVAYAEAKYMHSIVITNNNQYYSFGGDINGFIDSSETKKTEFAPVLIAEDAQIPYDFGLNKPSTTEQSNTISIFYKDKEMKLDKGLLKIDGKNYYPIKELTTFINAGGHYEDGFYGNDYKFHYGTSYVVTFTIGSDHYVTNGKAVKIAGGSCFLKDGVFYVPIRELYESLEFIVEWRADLNGIHITY